MPLIVEDGTGVTNANSYVSEDDAVAFAAARGANFVTDPVEVGKLLIKAMDYLESFRSQFQGTRTSATQALAWPRSGVYLDGNEFPDDAIPVELKNAQMQLAVDALELGDLITNTSGFAVARERVDVIEVEYAAGGRLSNATTEPQPELAKAQIWLDPLLGSNGQFLTTIRV